MTLFTIGHSTHRLDDFVAMLRAHGVERLVDVRTVPRSRHNPQFNRDTFSEALHNRHSSYRHLKSLGGLRHPRPESINTAWRNASFRGFADYMQTPEFEEGLLGILELADSEQCVLMCAEAVPWRCHRSLIGDALVARGARVEHIISSNERKLHVMTPWAQTDGLKIFYPSQADMG